MTALRTFSGIAEAAQLPGPLHLAIGMFDGLHLGHQAVIEACIHSAARAGGTAAVLSFWPHPSALMNPERRTRMMMPRETKRRVLARLGLNAFIEQSFTTEFAAIPGELFLAELKANLPGLAAIYVGENWRFGARRVGNIKLLLQCAPPLGISVFSAPRVNFNGETISSSRIRTSLAEGDMATVNALLGYSYFAEGRTAQGKQLGRTIGFPTLNLAWKPELAPAFGVYAVRVASAASIEAGSPQWHPAIANYGMRPTIGGSVEPLLESHLLGECPFDYGAEIVVEFCRFVRPEQRFSSLQELKQQIEKDTALVSSDFRLQGPP